MVVVQGALGGLPESLGLAGCVTGIFCPLPRASPHPPLPRSWALAPSLSEPLVHHPCGGGRLWEGERVKAACAGCWPLCTRGLPACPPLWSGALPSVFFHPGLTGSRK